MKRVIAAAALAVVLMVPAAGWAQREHVYQQRWCDEWNGVMESMMPDHTRCDCETDTHAIEFDHAAKWTEAVGQSLYYSLQTGKRAGIVLIVENDDDLRYWFRLNSVVQHFGLPIDTWKTEER